MHQRQLPSAHHHPRPPRAVCLVQATPDRCEVHPGLGRGGEGTSGLSPPVSTQPFLVLLWAPRLPAPSRACPSAKHCLDPGSMLGIQHVTRGSTYPYVCQLLGHQASICTVKVSPRRGTLGPSEERQLSLELTAHTQVSKVVRRPEGLGRYPATLSLLAGRSTSNPAPVRGQEISCIWVWGTHSC